MGVANSPEDAVRRSLKGPPYVWAGVYSVSLSIFTHEGENLRLN